MRYVRAGFFFFLMVCCWQLAFAQQQYAFYFRNDVKIVIDSDTIKNPWAGGLNSPVFSKIDLNQDGTEDLFAFDRTHNKIFTYLARQLHGEWQWQYAPEYEILFPRDLAGWVLLRDYNRDGRRDVFTKTNFGIKVYQNTTAADGILAFTLAEDFIRFDNNFNLQVSSENLPAILDLDNDGDLDILTFDFAGSSRIEYYKNLQQDENLLPNNLKYIRETQSWASLTKCEHACNGYVFNGNCRTTGTKHNEGTALLALDLDGDADKDILIGGENCPDLARITNSGTLTTALMSGTDLQTSFPGNSTPARFKYFPAAYYEEVDFDGKPDLLVAPFARSNTADDIDFSQSSWFYKNQGTAAVPDFRFVQQNFLQAGMLDAGEQAAPALADVDADGDQDMLVGHRQGSIWFFRNVGSATKALFKRERTDYLNISSLGLRDLKPQFADLNSDGKLDLVLAVTTGTTGAIKYLLNTANSGQPFSFDLTQIKTLVVGQGLGGVPAFFDLDQDGDQDLILANAPLASANSGILQFYRNTGTATNPVFSLVNEAWGGIAQELTRRNSFPLIIDLNQDNEPELLLADDTGELRIYSNIRQHEFGTFSSVSDIYQHPGTKAYEKSKLGSFVTLTAADLDGDQKPEILAGSGGGGIFYLGQQARGVLGTEEPAAGPVKLNIYPNPAARWLTISSPEEITYTIASVAGQRVGNNNTFRKTHQVNVAGLSPGLYIVQVQTRQSARANYKLIIQR